LDVIRMDSKLLLGTCSMSGCLYSTLIRYQANTHSVGILSPA
jgi:pyruvate/2-oxoglutarate dehydrogenase complex dihydrolipoamide dehydrogenase (E3) component